MKVSSATLELLRVLASHAVEQSDEVPDWAESYRQIRFVDPTETADPEQAFLSISGADQVLYEKCLDELTANPQADRLSRADVDHDLINLCRELVLDRERYKSPKLRERRIQMFLKALTKPIRQFEMLAVIDDLEIPEGEIQAGNVLFFQFEKGTELWGQGLNPGVEKHLLGRTVASVQVEAASLDVAIERAAGSIDTALSVLRVSMTSFRMRINDWQLLARRGRAYAVRSVDETRSVRSGWQLRFDPVKITLGGPLLSVTLEALAVHQPILDGTISGKLGARLVRALEWIGTSITRERDDDKVVDLCTALETLLTVESDPRKAEAVALRTMLLSMALDTSFYDPTEVYRLYLLRNQVIHGSQLGICADSDYLMLRQVAKDVLRQVIEMVSAHGLKQHGGLIEVLEEDEWLKRAATWLNELSSDDSQELERHPLAKYARERLAKRSRFEHRVEEVAARLRRVQMLTSDERTSLLQLQADIQAYLESPA